MLPKFVSQSSTNQLSEVKKLDKKFFTTKLLVSFAIELIVIVILILTFQFHTNPSSAPTTVASGQNQYQSEQTENKVVSNKEIQAEMNKILESMEETKWLSSRINQHLVFQTGDAEGVIMLENSPHNTCLIKCVITADVNDDGKEEKLYDSGLMPINSHIQEDVLSVDLDKGEYEATATYTAYSTDNVTEIDSVAIPIHISVLG